MTIILRLPQKQVVNESLKHFQYHCETYHDNCRIIYRCALVVSPNSPKEVMKRRNYIVGPLLFASGIGILLFPGAKQLPSYRPTSHNGVKSIKDAVLVCQQTGLQGWDLVAYAQKLVSRKFTIYSVFNLWDTPSRAFVYGMGYCTQYNLALKNLLENLGFAVTAVFSLKVRVLDDENWTMGHTWLRVTIDGETRDVCAGRVENEPGKVNFVPVWPVHHGHIITLFLTHLGMILFCGALSWKSLLTGNPPLDWMYNRRLPEGM